MSSNTTDLIAASMRDIELKQMDPATLAFAIRHEGSALGVDADKLSVAMELASCAHLLQTRIGRGDSNTDPYIIHPFRNVLRLIRYGCHDIDVLQATALHDTVEDQPANIVKILSGGSTDQGASSLLAEHFGSETARLVDAVTNPPSDGAAQSPEDKHAAYVEHVSDVIVDPKVFLVKFADFIDNAGSVRYLKHSAKKDKLTAKYAPLIPVFLSQLEEFDGTLDISADGYTTMAAALENIPAS